MSDSLPIPERAETLISQIAETLAETQGSEREDERAFPEPAMGETMISFSHVSMSFDERKVLDNVSFSVNRGQTLCILGRSGVGKSVALRILMGFLKPQVGSIRVEGEEINASAKRGCARFASA